MMDDAQLADGLVIVAATIRDPRVREQFWFHMENLAGERVTPTVSELSIADWGEGLWDEEVQWTSELLENDGGRVEIWKFD
jgi:hypothetical protein